MPTSKKVSAKSGLLEVVYHEQFAKGPGAWTSGKVVSNGTWHKNILGEVGNPVPLGWSKTGGRRGPFAYTEPPWYFDDNHGEYMWLYLTFFVNRSEMIGLAGRDLRDAQVRLAIRGHEFNAKGARLQFWIQGDPGESAPYRKGAMFNWTLSSQPIADILADGQWHDETVTLFNDETKWSFMGHLNGGLSRRIRVIQSLSIGHGTLETVLSGSHVNFGFLLFGVDPNDPPTGRIDVEEVTFLAMKK